MAAGKKARWILAGVAVLLAAGFVIVKHRARHEPEVRIALADGTELRLEYVTFGTEHRVPGAGALVGSLSQLANRWFPKQVPYYSEDYMQTTAESCPVLWFTCRDPQTGKLSKPAIQSLEVVHGRETYRAGPSLGSGAPPLPNQTFALPVYSRRLDRLHVRLTLKSKTYELDVKNAGAGMDFPAWQPEPLPQTRRVGRREYVLSEIEYDPGNKRSGANVKCIVREDGKEVTEGFFCSTEFLDATGNRAFSVLPLDEPAWKLRVTFRRTTDYDFAPDEGITLGPVQVPGPGVCRDFVVPPEEMKKGLCSVMLVGPGHYVWHDEKLVFAEGDITGANDAGLDSGDHRSNETTSPHPEFHLFTKGTSAQPWVKNGQDAVVFLKMAGEEYIMEGLGSWGDDWAERTFRPPDGEDGKVMALTGAISIRVIPIEAETVEFLVAPPKPPGPSP